MGEFIGAGGLGGVGERVREGEGMARAQTAADCGEWNAQFFSPALHLEVEEPHVIHIVRLISRFLGFPRA